MLAKLRLDQTKKYEHAIATYEIAYMLIHFALGRKHFMRIGSEQGEISKWDDIVIEASENCIIHFQVKRHTSRDFVSANHRKRCHFLCYKQYLFSIVQSIGNNIGNGLRFAGARWTMQYKTFVCHRFCDGFQLR